MYYVPYVVKFNSRIKMAPSFFEPHSNIVHIEEGGVSKVESDRSLSKTNQVVADV